MMAQLLLLASLLPLLVAPPIARWADGSPATRALVDRFVAVILGGLVLLHIWPDALLDGGAAALVVGLLGLALPFLFHGRLHALEERAFPGMVWLAFGGLVVHAALDGVALLAPEHEAASSSALLLALAVILHRLPTALALWWLTVPLLGRRAAITLLVAMGVATLVGFSVVGELLIGLSPGGLAIFEAGVAGMLLHVVLGHHRHHHHRPETADAEHQHVEHQHGEQGEIAEAAPWASVAGVVFGLVVLGGLSWLHPLTGGAEILDRLGDEPRWVLALLSVAAVAVLVAWWTARRRRSAAEH